MPLGRVLTAKCQDDEDIQRVWPKITENSLEFIYLARFIANQSVITQGWEQQDARFDFFFGQKTREKMLSARIGLLLQALSHI